MSVVDTEKIVNNLFITPLLNIAIKKLGAKKASVETAKDVNGEFVILNIKKLRLAIKRSPTNCKTII